jgi:hypothetical protein
MATIIWRGDAAVAVQVERFAVTNLSLADVGEDITFTINGKDIVVPVTNANGGTLAAYYASCTAAIGQYDNDIAEFAEVSASADSVYLYLTGPVSGKPFVCTAVSSSVDLDVAQSTTTAATGPNDASNADNWTGGAVPGTGDTVIFENNDVDCLYGLDAITGDTLAALRIKASYTGRIGLPAKNDDYYEYRDIALQLGATAVYVGEGTGSGSGRINLDLEAVQTEVIVYGTGDPDDAAIGALTIIGSNANNVIRVAKGFVGIATAKETDTAVVSVLELSFDQSPDSDSNVIVGRGVTLTTLKVYGGEHRINADFATMVQYGGTVYLLPGVSPGTSIDILEGRCYYDSDGTLTQGYVSDGGELIFGKFDTRTVTNLSVYAGATVRDPFKTVTWSNPIALVRCAISEVTLDLGTGITLAPA